MRFPLPTLSLACFGFLCLPSAPGSEWQPGQVVGGPLGSIAQMIGYDSRIPESGLDEVIDMAVGSDGVALHPDGTVTTWSTPNIAAPAGLKPVVKVAGRGTYVVALQDDGTVAAWGGGYPKSNKVPADLTDVVEIATGYYHALALKADGSLVIWGEDIGYRSLSPTYYLEVPPTLGDRIVDIAGGYVHNMALRADGSVHVWGAYDSSAQAPSPVASAPSGMKPAIDIACGYGFNTLLHDNGSITAFGGNNSGVLSFPPQSNVVSISAKDSALGVVYENGTAAAWGAFAPVPNGLTNIVRFDPHWVESAFLTMPAQRPFGRIMPKAYSSRAGKPLLMHCHAVGSGKLGYQWKRNGRELPGETHRWLRVDSLSASDEGTYTCVVTNAHGEYETAESSIAVDTGTGGIDIEDEEVVVSIADGIAPLPLRVPLVASGFPPGDVSVTSDAPGVSAAIDEPASEIVLTFDPVGIPHGETTATIRASAGGRSDTLSVKIKTAPANISRLIADPIRPRVYGVHRNGVASGALIVWDSQTGGSVRSITLGTNPTDLAVQPDGSEILAINAGDRTISVIDPVRLSVVETIDPVPMPAWDDSVGGAKIGVRGNMIYYTDRSWAPVMRTYDRVTGKVVQSLDIKGNIVAAATSYNGDHGFGDFALSPDGTSLHAWAQYGWSAGWSGSYIARFRIGDNGALALATATSSTHPTILRRDPLDSPIFTDSSGESIFVKELQVNAVAIDSIRRAFPSTIRSISPGGELTFTAATIFDTPTGRPLFSLPHASDVQAVTFDSSRLVYFHGGRLESIDLLAALGNDFPILVAPPDGGVVLNPVLLRWNPIPGTTSYRVYFGVHRAEVESENPKPTLLVSETTEQSFALPADLPLGVEYFWRVDAITATGTVAGQIRSFILSGFSVDHREILAETVEGHRNLRVPIRISSSGSTASWNASANREWIRFDSSQGTAPGVVNVFLDAGVLEPGVHTASITLANSLGGPVDIPVQFTVAPLKLTHLKSDPASSRVFGISEDTETIGARAYLVEFDTESETILRVAQVGDSVTDLALHYEDRAIYVPNWMSGVLQAIDLDTFQILQTYPFTPLGDSGSGGGDVYRVTPVGPGRLVIEEADQWIDIGIFDTETGEFVSSTSAREGGGASSPDGRFYYHGDNNSSGANIRKFNIETDTFVPLAQRRVESASHYGSRVVLVSEDGQRVFWNGSVFDADLVEEWTLGTHVYSTSANGRLAFSERLIHDVSKKQVVLGMPVDTKVSAFNSATRKLVVQRDGAFECHPIPDPYVMSAPVLQAGRATSSTVELAWLDASLETGFSVQYRPSGETAWSDLPRQTGRNQTSVLVRDLAAWTHWEFRIRADSPEFSSPWSNIVSATTTGPSLDSPYQFTATISGDAVALSWFAVPDATGYVVERSVDGGEWNVLANVEAPASSHMDRHVDPGTICSYRAKAVRNAAASQYTAVVTVPIPAPPLPAPEGANIQILSDGSVVLTWIGNNAASGYVIERRLAGGGMWTAITNLTANQNSYADLSGTARHEYRIAAVNEHGQSDYSLVDSPSRPKPPAARPSRDRKLPRVQILGSRHREVRSSSAFLIGRALDNRGVRRLEYRVLGEKGRHRIRNARSWVLRLDIEHGRNTIVLHATDTSGNRSRPTRVVIMRAKRE